MNPNLSHYSADALLNELKGRRQSVNYRPVCGFSKESEINLAISLPSGSHLHSFGDVSYLVVGWQASVNSGQDPVSISAYLEPLIPAE